MKTLQLGISVYCLVAHIIYVRHATTSGDWQSKIMNMGVALGWIIAAALWWPQ